MTQLSLALPGAHDARTQLAMAQADAHANEQWRRVTDAAILFAAMRLETFTVDDVLDELANIPDAPSTHNLSALGPRMKEVSKTLGYMEATDRVKRSRRPEKNGNLHRLWKSRVYKP
jgi:hypothetical protein